MSKTNRTEFDNLANRLAPHYSHFGVSNRLLFTGHSHQAWPDVARSGLLESFEVSASKVDKKWELAFEKTEKLRAYLRNYYDDADGMYTLGQNTHQLLITWLSALDINRDSKIITTEGEFHSMSRQLKRLNEEGLEIITLPSWPDELFIDRLKKEIDDNTTALMCSRVYFQSGLINRAMDEAAAVARRHGVPFLIDDYHGTNVVPLSIKEANLEDCYLLIGGYKYLQWGEGNCFLRYPKTCTLRPVITGWFASFSTIEDSKDNQKVQYEDDNQLFASATFDSASQFRAATVVDFFRKQGLTPTVLRRQYLQQTAFMREKFMALDIQESVISLHHNENIEHNGGFLALKTSHASTLQRMLMKRNVFTDARGDTLRLGPAPYTTSKQIEDCFDMLDDCIGLL